MVTVNHPWWAHQPRESDSRSIITMIFHHWSMYASFLHQLATILNLITIMVVIDPPCISSIHNLNMCFFYQFPSGFARDLTIIPLPQVLWWTSWWIILSGCLCCWMTMVRPGWAEAERWMVSGRQLSWLNLLIYGTIPENNVVSFQVKWIGRWSMPIMRVEASHTEQPITSAAEQLVGF